MKKLLLTLFAAVASVCSFAADGDVFYANSIEGASVRYQVKSESAKTAVVYGISTSDRAIAADVTALTIPATVEHDGATYTVTGITNHSFWSLGKLKTVTLPATIKECGTSAFRLSGITKVDIADVAKWCEISFANAGANPLYQLSLNNGTLYVNGVDVTEELVISGVTEIPALTFNYVPVKKVILDEGVRVLGSQAFYGSKTLEQVTFPSTIEEIGSAAFGNCTAMKVVNLESAGGVAAWCGLNFASGTANPLQGADLYVQGVKAENLVIPSTVTKVNPYVFTRSKIKSVTFENGVQEIGEQAFYECSDLVRVSFPSSLTVIGSAAFGGCTSMSEVDLSSADGVAKWCAMEFASGSANPLQGADLYLQGVKAENVVIPGTVTKVNPYVFTRANIKSVTFENGVQEIGEQAFYACAALESVAFPSSLQDIGSAAFGACSAMEKVILDGAAGIANWCGLNFASGSANPLSSAKNLYIGNTQVTDLVIPGTVTEVKPYVFNYANVQTITLSEGVQTVGTQCFYHCDNVTELTIPTSLQTVEASAFGTCTNLEKVNISSLKDWCDIDFDSGSSNPLQNAHFLYMGGEKVTDLVIPDNVTSIKPYAFNYSGITSVTIPSTVATIGQEAFFHCDNLIDIICTGAPADVSYSTTFDNRTRSEATVYAPVASLADYIEHATWWNQFAQYGAEIMEGEPYTNTEDIDIPSGKVLRVRYSRTFKNNNWQAWFMPFDVEASELEDYFDIAVFDGANSDDEAFEDGKLHLGYTYVKDDVLEANKPYIVKLKSEFGKNHQLQIRADIQKIWGFDGVTEHTQKYGICEFVGTYTQFNGLYDEVSSYYQWALSGGLLCRAKTSAATLQPYRWYLRIAKADVDPAVYNVIDQLITFDVMDGNETAVERIEANVETDEAWYNLAGQRVERPTKGVYVKNGKKVLF